jgi:hypothetical protein
MTRRLVGALIALTLPLTAQKPAAPFGCPEKLAVAETATPIEGWKASGGKSEHAFERVSIYNGKAGGTEYELAPDGQSQQGVHVTQTWKLKDYRKENIFLRCRYHDTPIVLLRDIPAGVEACTFTFTSEKKGDFLGKSALTCQ